jgi:tetratricopeptide (TPR) repeat protein
MRLTACLIVRDEEPRLGACLDSLRGVVEEVCVLDTGSRDGTVELALERGARVASAPWQEDFAAARNASLAMATGDWILVLDADERLAMPSARARSALEAFAGRRPGCVGRVLLENLEDDEVIGRARVSRLLPNDRRHRFHGRVHEQILRDGAEPARADVAVVVRHEGYQLTPRERARKLSRNARLLERELQRAPDAGYLWFQLGRTRALADDPTGALAALERALERCPDDAPWGIAALEEGAYALRRLGASDQALALLEQVEPRWRGRPDTCFVIALLALDIGDLARAERGFRHCLTLAAVAPDGAETAPAASTYAPAYNLGMMCEVLGRRDEAEAHYRTALGHLPGHRPSLAGLARLAGAANRA